MFEADPDTKAVVLIGEIGGSAEEDAALLIGGGLTKPVIGYIAGLTAPPGRRMGHAGAIISGSAGTAARKVKLLREAGAHMVRNPAEIGKMAAAVLSGKA
jgi:succinyl-CoA synthetase alpha subunit